MLQWMPIFYPLPLQKQNDSSGFSYGSEEEQHSNNANVHPAASLLLPNYSSQDDLLPPATEAAAKCCDFLATFSMQESLCHSTTIRVPTSAMSFFICRPPKDDNHTQRGL